jgi:hypothetical protein
MTKDSKYNEHYWDTTRNLPYGHNQVNMSVPEGLEFNKPYSLHELADKAMYGGQSEIFGEYTKPKLEMDKPNYEKNPTPNYYIGSVYGYEARKIIQDFKLSYNIGNVTSYLLRAGKKYEAGMSNMDKHIEDLIKAKNHIQFEIEELQLEQAKLKHIEVIKSGVMLKPNLQKAPPMSILPDDTGKCLSCEEKRKQRAAAADEEAQDPMFGEAKI